MSRSVWALLLGLPLLFSFSSSAPALATTIKQMDLREMTRSSPTIVHGTVISSRSRWNDDHSMIVTDVRVRVAETLKGQAGEEIVITQPGGRIGALRVEVPGAAAFRADDEVVLFLSPGPREQIHVNGLAQGRFDVITDRHSGKKTVRGIPMESQTDLGGYSPLATNLSPGKRPLALGQFLKGLRGLVLEVKQIEAK